MPLLIASRNGLYFIEDGGNIVPLRERKDFLALARSPSDSSVYYAATTTGGVYRNDHDARSWVKVGALPDFEELSCLAVHPHNPDQLLAGMEPSALFRSDDGGVSWGEAAEIRQLSEANGWSVPWSDAKGHVRAISIDPNDPRRIYLAIEVGGVVRSEDGGETWENVRGGIHDDVHTVAVNHKDGNIVYAATRHGFGRSEDYGKTWQRIDGFEGQGYARPLAVNPARPDQVFTAAATTGPGGFGRPDVGSECGIFRSDDGGLAWKRLTNGIPAHFKPYVDALDIDPAQPERVALADTDGHLYLSEDSGDSWRHLADAPPVRRLLWVE